MNESQKTDFELIKYETILNLQRLALEQQWVKHRPAKISADGIINVPGGKQWYAYYLKRWVSDDVTPDQIFNFGLQEVKRVQEHIEAIHDFHSRVLNHGSLPIFMVKENVFRNNG